MQSRAATENKAPSIQRLIPANPSAGVRQDVFSLTEGPVTIQWPATLSPESFQDLADWLDIVKRKIGRSVKSETTE
jgi:hypothetical protein